MSRPDLDAIRRRLLDRELRELFIEELGWDRTPPQEIRVDLDGRRFIFTDVAHKRGMVVCIAASQEIPDHQTRARLERALARTYLEHIVVYLDAHTQAWVWARRDPGQSVKLRSHWLHHGQAGNLLAQQLAELHFSLEDEDSLNLVGVTGRARKAFDADSITRAFYTGFQNEQRAFSAFINGIPDEANRSWYASVMLNRLMFTYFIQKKGFLDGDVDYLPNRLKAVRTKVGPDRFLSFYRHFLLRLFHGGFSRLAVEPDVELDQLVGKVPYINGGLFGIHELEQRYPIIDIPDDAFARLFGFFADWKWHLDERPLRDDREINPDVLGYIFEKYINQKELGAYYTKEDITSYMADSTVLPAVLDRAKARCPAAFEQGSALWSLLTGNPNRYIHDAMLHGNGVSIPQVVLGDESLWNQLAPSTIGLPTELWREVIARRAVVDRLCSDLERGHVHDGIGLIRANLNVRQFVQDAIDTAETPELVDAFYWALRGLTILDPACGSGAFLFAVLSMLEPLYEACLIRMADFVNSHEAHESELIDKFTSVLAEVERHPNRSYFVLKTIVVGNLYGVDLVPEAVEICRLRLFLKLAAQLANPGEIEPLPDIDFNVRSGNSLVGYSRMDSLDESVHQGALDFSGHRSTLMGAVTELHKSVSLYRADQLQLGGPQPGNAAKVSLEASIRQLASRLDRFLAASRGISGIDEATYRAWQQAHRPLHWGVEFADQMMNGGFDVVIGNPPYIELEALEGYSVEGLKTIACGNTYALFFERGLQLLKANGHLAFIVPVSSVSVDGYRPLRDILASYDHFYSSFDDRPSRLFDGLEHIRLTIHLVGPKRPTPSRFSTTYQRWYGKERATLFKRLRYIEPTDTRILAALPKMSEPFEHELLTTLAHEREQLGRFVVASPIGGIYYTRKAGNFLQVLDFQPLILDESRKTRPPSELKLLYFGSVRRAQLVLCALNSTLFYWFFTVFSDCRNLNRREIDSFPIDVARLECAPEGDDLARLGHLLMKRVRDTSEMRRMSAGRGKGMLEVQCIFPGTAKSLIDEIDLVLGKFLGLKNETIDSIQNFHVKYRLGLGK